MKKIEFKQRFLQVASEYLDQSVADDVVKRLHKALDESNSTDEKIVKASVEAYKLSNETMLKILAAELEEFLVDENDED